MKGLGPFFSPYRPPRTYPCRTHICDGLARVIVIVIVALQASAHVRRVHDVRRRWSEISCGGSSVCI